MSECLLRTRQGGNDDDGDRDGNDGTHLAGTKSS